MSNSHWSIWTEFLNSLHINDPYYLTDFEYPNPLLQVFAEHLRTGEIAPSDDPLRSRSVEDYVCSIGQEITSLRTLDPRIMVNGKFDPRLEKQLKAYARLDTPGQAHSNAPCCCLGYF
jgi:hypothetical protein